MAAEAWNNRDGIELRRCDGCGLVFSVKDEYVYEELFNDAFVNKTKDDLVRMARAEGSDRLVADLVEKSKIAKGARVLDFGGGVGLTALMFQDHGVDAAVVE